MTSNSNFLSNFNIGGGSLIDIMSTVSGPIPLTAYSSSSDYYHTFYGRYFYLGNLLIQFSDISQGNLPTPGSGKTVTTTFPIPFSAPPYTVLLTAKGAKTYYVLFDTTSTNFEAKNEGDNAASFAFLAIGPR